VWFYYLKASSAFKLLDICLLAQLRKISKLEAGLNFPIFIKVKLDKNGSF
jgi:hypothetical protein